ncbi:hypothetical protein SEA_SIXAMA_125 [Gordonia phage Sixama]|uniref:Uncharacterized protein n=1 Tax=Gordonia phage Sixama TaxID=2653271 RepID=A0A5Q2F5D9_9CAUD|nr:hypothetical protein PP302_gp125 [Gordonia phage Sixama]QGF20304.1 hypothetical protein SEA_SIXAMA_125 [Gordonia phage Sixama]
MRILITGMTSRQVNEKTRDGFITLSGAIAGYLRESGHDVDVRAYSFSDQMRSDIAPYDRVFVGLGPLKGIGTAYMYGAIQCLREYQKDAILFVDDTDTLKMGREFKTILKRPYDYTKPFFMYKREWAIVEGSEEIKNEHLNVIDALAGNKSWYWDFLVPSWNFDLAYTAGSKICPHAANRAVSFDPSSAFAIDGDVSEIDREPVWGTTWNSPSPAINRMGVREWDVETIPTYSKHRFSEVSGILVPNSTWAPEITIATSVGTPVACDWRTLGPYLGAPFEALTANIELMGEKDRQNLAIQQKNALLSNSSGSPETVLEKLLEKLHN